MATMNDVARVANVSIATVSHVINGTRFVSAERVERVQAAMQQLGYTPDATARSLRVGRTDTIGLVIPDNSNPFFAALARWIEEAGFEAGYTTILANSNERPDREHRYVSTLVSKRVDGLILSRSRGDRAPARHRRALHRARFGQRPDGRRRHPRARRAGARGAARRVGDRLRRRPARRDDLA